ncbi:MAG: porphobilinogen synthase, partial [Cytophagales bacterium]|nr:porphobilinogen synthase [Cytophagales bacterium]
MTRRPRRHRQSATVRALVRETHLHVSELIYPLFLIDGRGRQVEVSSMPGISRWSPDLLLREIEDCLRLGLRTFALFPALDDALKDPRASESINENGLYLSTLRLIKKELPEACLMTDVAMDPYSSDGHDGLVHQGEILN